VLKDRKPWAEAGHEVAFEQFILPDAPCVDYIRVAEEASPIAVSEDDQLIVITGSRFAIRFDRASGDLVSYAMNGHELLSGPIVPNFWRAMTDNDRGNRLHERSRVWREAGAKRSLAALHIEQEAGCVRITSAYRLWAAADSRCFLTYAIHGDGRIGLDFVLSPAQNLPELPEVGILFEMAGGYDSLSWYGKGPHESYWDRQTGAKLGLYTGKVQEQFVPYLRPQECGNKMEVRRAEVSDEAGTGIRIVGHPKFEWNVLPYTPWELEEHDHAYKLPAPGLKTVVRVIAHQSGVGGDDSWGARPHPEYTLPANRDYRLRVTLQGF